MASVRVILSEVILICLLGSVCSRSRLFDLNSVPYMYRYLKRVVSLAATYCCFNENHVFRAKGKKTSQLNPLAVSSCLFLSLLKRDIDKNPILGILGFLDPTSQSLYQII